MRFLVAVTLFAVLSGSAFADDWVKAADFKWPDHWCQVVLKNYPVRVGWVEGHPWGDRQDCAPLLNLPTGGDTQIDLEHVLIEKNFLIRFEGGTIEAKPGRSDSYSPSSSINPPPTRHRNRPGDMTPAEQYTQQKEIERRADAMKPHLVGFAEKYIAETDYIRAVAVIKNVGGSTSEPCTAVGEFVDWYHRKFAEHKLTIGPLEPGQSVEVTFFSLVHKDDQNPNGVIKADKYTCDVKFEP